MLSLDGEKSLSRRQVDRGSTAKRFRFVGRVTPSPRRSGWLYLCWRLCLLRVHLAFHALHDVLHALHHALHARPVRGRSFVDCLSSSRCHCHFSSSVEDDDASLRMMSRMMKTNFPPSFLSSFRRTLTVANVSLAA